MNKDLLDLSKLTQQKNITPDRSFTLKPNLIHYEISDDESGIFLHFYV